MTKLDQNFDYWTGTDKTLFYSIIDASSGASTDTTNWTVAWLLQDEPGTASLLRIVTGNGIVASGSVIRVALAGSLTAGCNLSGTYYTELSASTTASSADVLAVGYATINRKG